MFQIRSFVKKIPPTIWLVHSLTKHYTIKNRLGKAFFLIYIKKVISILLCTEILSTSYENRFFFCSKKPVKTLTGQYFIDIALLFVLCRLRQSSHHQDILLHHRKQQLVRE